VKNNDNVKKEKKWKQAEKQREKRREKETEKRNNKMKWRERIMNSVWKSAMTKMTGGKSKRRENSEEMKNENNQWRRSENGVKWNGIENGENNSVEIMKNDNESNEEIMAKNNKK